MSKFSPALELIFRHLKHDEACLFIGGKMRLMSSAECVQCLGYLSSGQLSDVLSMVNARRDSAKQAQ